MSGASLSQVAKDLAPIVNAMLGDFDSEKDSLKIQAFGYSMRKLLLDKDGAVMERILPRNCGVHPENRQSEMRIPIAVWSCCASWRRRRVLILRS